MKIEIDYIKDAGNIDKERIVFMVKEDLELGKYLIAESVILDGSRFSASIKNTFWFPDQEVKAGDKVVLYTKSGHTNITDNKNGTRTFFYYWGLNKPHLNDHKPCVVLFEASWKVAAIPNTES